MTCWVAVDVALALGSTALGSLLAACGDDDDAVDTGGEMTARATSTGGGANATATTGDAGEGSTGSGDTHVVEMKAENKFDPQQLTVKVSETITGRIVGAAPHSSTGDPSKAADPSHAQLLDRAPTWNSGILTNEGVAFSSTVEVAGDYTCLCILHEPLGMIGRLTVVTRAVSRERCVRGR